MLTENKLARYGFFAVLCLYLLLYLLPLGVRPMLRPDEFRYAEVPREMIASRNWLSPRLGGVRYFEKPSPGYQLTAVSLKLFGENAFAVRLPQALAVGVAAAFLFFLMGKTNKEKFPAVLAAGIFLTFGLVFGVGTFAVLDSLLAAALTLSIGSFYLACVSEKKSTVFLWLVAAGIGAGAAFLFKGLLGFVIPSLTAAGFLIWKREWKKLFCYPWIPLAAALAIVAPWAWMIHRAEPDFWNYFLVEEHWNRFTGSTYDRDPQPFWFFLPVLAGGILPAGLVWFFAWKGWKKSFFSNSLTVFCLCWFGLPFLFLSASSCKLATYILPCFPPLAILTALAVWNAVREHRAFVQRVSARIFTIVGMVLFAAGCLGLTALPFVFRLLYGGPVLMPMIALAAVAIFGFFLYSESRKGAYRKLYLLTVGLCIVVPLGLFSVPSAVFGEKMTELGMTACLRQMPLSVDDAVIVERSLIAPVSWVLKRNDIRVFGKVGEWKYGVEKYPEHAARYYSFEELPRLLSELPRGKRVFITGQNLKRKPLPSGMVPIESVRAGGVTFVRF